MLTTGYISLPDLGGALRRLRGLQFKQRIVAVPNDHKVVASHFLSRSYKNFRLFLFIATAGYKNEKYIYGIFGRMRRFL